MAIARVKAHNITINSLGLSVPETSYYICDSKEDLDKLPTDPINAAAGSIAVVLGYKLPDGVTDINKDKSKWNDGYGEGASEAYMMGASGKWIRYKGISMIN